MTKYWTDGSQKSAFLIVTYDFFSTSIILLSLTYFSHFHSITLLGSFFLFFTPANPLTKALMCQLSNEKCNYFLLTLAKKGKKPTI